MGAEDARTSWRARAEVELGGAPLRTLVRRRPDALEIEPIEFADAGREEGLPSRPMCRSIALVVEERALDAARPLLDAVDVLWLRGSREAISTTPVVLEPTGDHVDRASITSALYLSDAGTERLLGRPPRPWDPRDAIGAAVLHDGGGGPVTQIAIVIALMLERRGVLGTARPPAVAVALSPEIFVEISKLRALRRLIDRVLTTLGEP